jgi:hypothetical protein
MSISSRYETTKELVKGQNMFSINLIKFVGVFIKPKGMTIHSKIPSVFRIESILPYISPFYWDLVVARVHINLTKVLVSLELVEKVVN